MGELNSNIANLIQTKYVTIAKDGYLVTTDISSTEYLMLSAQQENTNASIAGAIGWYADSGVYVIQSLSTVQVANARIRLVYMKK